MTSLTINPELKQIQPLEQEEYLLKTKSLPSACRFCHFYKFHGRSGGYCNKLGVSVHSNWRSCPLAMSSFSPSWEGNREIPCSKWKEPKMLNIISQI